MKMFGELNIIKDHIHFRIIKRTKPLTIHTECMHKENVWKSAQQFVNMGGRAIWFVVTPVNFDFVQTETGCAMNRGKWERTIADRYKWLAEHGQQIEAHVHLRVKMSMYDSERMMENDARSKITGAAAWLNKNGFKPSRIVFGWWSYNRFAVNTAKEYGMDTVKRLDNYFIHDYDLL